MVLIDTLVSCFSVTLVIQLKSIYLDRVKPETMEEPVIVGVKIFVILFIAIFIPATAYTFFRFRLKKKEDELGRVLTIIGIKAEEKELLMPTIRSEQSPVDYVLPVLFSFFTVLLTMTLLMFGGGMVEMGEGATNNLLLAGGRFVEGGTAAFLREKQSIAVVTMALMGGFIWSSQNIVRRLVTADLSPGTYYNSGIRMIMSGLIALMVSFIIPSDKVGDYMIVTAFLIGLFPEKGLRYLVERIKVLPMQSKDQSHPLPLEMIEGMSLFHKVRLAEIGVDNAQNLAETNLILLMVRTPFNVRTLLDWIGQAKLAVGLKEDLFRITNEGVRTIFDLMIVGKEDGKLEALAEKTGVSFLKLHNIHTRAIQDQGLIRLLDTQNRLSIAKEYNPGA